MCGIVAYIGGQNATPIVLGGLKKLEYRGYDSAGIAVLQNGKIEIRRDAGKIDHLETLITQEPLEGNLGIGHTRWATHGAPNMQNAHPHISSNGEIVIVHNGIVENYLSLREELSAEGAVFRSETDTETIVLLIEHYYAVTQDLLRAVQETLKRIKGAHGIVVMSSREPDKLVAARLGNAGGIAIGRGNGEMFIASDLPAIVEHTHDITFLDSEQIAVVQKDGLTLQTLAGTPIEPVWNHIPWDPVSAEKGRYRHFMQKEIHEQVRSLSDTMVGRIDFDDYRILLPDLHLKVDEAKNSENIHYGLRYSLSCRFSWEILIEQIAHIPVEVMVASEFRYLDPIIEEGTIVLAISQSGETADTLAAMEEGRRKGAKLWSIVNAIGSQAMRIADGTISMQVAQRSA